MNCAIIDRLRVVISSVVEVARLREIWRSKCLGFGESGYGSVQGISPRSVNLPSGYPLHEPKDVVWQLVVLDQAEFVHLELKGCPHLRERFDEFLRITLATVLTGAQMRRKTSRESPDAVMEFEIPPIDLRPSTFVFQLILHQLQSDFHCEGMSLGHGG